MICAHPGNIIGIAFYRMEEMTWVSAWHLEMVTIENGLSVSSPEPPI
jgi:hypothetical protein